MLDDEVPADRQDLLFSSFFFRFRASFKVRVLPSTPSVHRPSSFLSSEGWTPVSLSRPFSKPPSQQWLKNYPQLPFSRVRVWVYFAPHPRRSWCVFCLASLSGVRERRNVSISYSQSRRSCRFAVLLLCRYPVSRCAWSETWSGCTRGRPCRTSRGAWPARSRSTARSPTRR